METFFLILLQRTHCIHTRIFTHSQCTSWKRDWHLIQKYHNFIYQMASVGSCSGLHSYKETCQLTGFEFFFSFLSSLITTCSPNCPTHNALLHMTCSWWLTLCEPSFFTLQNYNSIHIFSSLTFCFVFSDFKVLHFTCSIRTSQISSDPELKASEFSFLLLR